ncbi:MAG: hypothetical protein E6767_00555 [Dysgonomonas sp.]|nr:hypothetical protein [Dysgonomonas sp.]
MFELDDNIEYPDFPEEGFREVQQCLDRFVGISYETASGMLYRMKPTPEEITLYRGKILDIIRHNPPLESVPRYFHDGRENYLWYSDFYDDITKEVYQRYRTFKAAPVEINPANYAEELDKIDLPYFKELVDLITLERLLMKYEDKVSEPKTESEEDLSDKKTPAAGNEETKIEIEATSQSKTKRTQPKRSYEPKLNNKQYTLLAECIEQIKLFRLRLKVTDLKKLLKGKLTEPLEVTNQKTLVYLLERLKEYHYIKEKWISVADGNKDFISFRTEGNRQRYGDEQHYIPMQQFQNNRKKSEKEAVRGLIIIDEAIEEMNEYRDE